MLHFSGGGGVEALSKAQHNSKLDLEMATACFTSLRSFINSPNKTAILRMKNRVK
jgi:hypothetical protein